VSESDAKRWREAVSARNQVWSAAVDSTLEDLTATTDELRARALWQLALYFAASLLAVILVMATNRVVLRVIRGLLGELTQAMQELAMAG